MNTLDELIRAVLNEEAADAPATDTFVARVLREQRTADDVPQRGKWAVLVAVAAVTALIVSVAVASSLSGRSSGGVPAHPGPDASTPAPRTASEIPPGHAGRLSGWIALSSGPVHIELNSVPPVGAPWKVWRVGCPDSVLSFLDSGDVACAGTGKVPRYEVMVAPGTSLVEDTDLSVRWDGPLRPVSSAQAAELGGTPVVVRMTSGDVRYGCPENCGSWVTRNLTVISIPDQDRHVTILGPADRRQTVSAFGHLSGDLDWLIDYIYVDP